MSTPARQMLEQLRVEQQKATQPTARQLLEQMRAQQGANVSPFPVPEPRNLSDVMPPPTGGMGMGILPPSLIDPVSKEYRAAAAKGVDVDTGIQDIDRASLSLAPNQAYEADFAKTLLKKRFGKDVQVRIGPESNAIEFLSPQSNRWTTIDERGMSRADIKDLLGPSMVAGPAMVGGTVGSLGGPAGTAAGGGMGAFLGEGSRLLYGRRKGVHDLSDADIATEALKAGGFEIAATVASEKVLHLGQTLKKFFSGRALPQDEASKILRDIEAAMEDVGAIRQGGGTGFNPTIPQMLDDEALQSELSAATAVNRDRVVAEQERQRTNKTALEDYFDQTVGPDPTVRERVGAQLEGQNTLRTDQLRTDAEGRLAAQQEGARQAVEATAPPMDSAGAGRQIRSIAEGQLNELKATRKAAWKEYESAIGLNPETSLSRYSIPMVGEPAAAISSMAREMKLALFGFEKSQLRSVLPKELLAAAEKGNGFDLAVLDRSLKALRGIKRSADTGFSPGLSSGQIIRLETALKTARADFLRVNDPAALEALERAEAATIAQSNFEKNSALSDILRRDKGSTTYRVADDSQVFRKVIVANDVEAAGLLREAAGSDPAKLNALKQGIWMVYRANFTDAGLPSLKLHQKFVEQYGDLAKQFFTKPEWEQVQRFGEFGAVLEKSAKETEQFVKRLSTGLSKKIESGRADDALKMMLNGDLNARDARWLASELRRGGFMDDAMKVFGAEIRDKITKNGEMNLSALSDLLQRRGSQIAEFAGPEYVKNLRILERGLSRSQRVSAAKLGPEGTLWGRMSRVLFRPLSREGLLRTAVRGQADSRSNQVMYEILTDPAKLKEFVAVGNRRLTDRRVVALLASIGGASYLSDREIAQ